MSYQNHAWKHRPKAQGGTDPIAIPPTLLPTVRIAITTGLTVTDGAYYGLAQTIGANPSANGIADTFEFLNDPGDGTGVFDVQAVGSGGVLMLINGAGDGLLLAYDAGIVFDASINTAAVTASLYLGRGVAGGGFDFEFETLEAVMASNVSSTGTPTLRLTGHLPVTTFGGGTRPTISPILLVEGGTPTVLSGWCFFTILSEVTSTAFYP